jgi:predicted transcriptional regulator
LINIINIKQKGLFETYDTITNNKMYWKDTSANIIPLALNNYFINHISVEETVFRHNNIHDFCKSAKK